MRHAGDHYVAVRGRQIDKVFALRDELEATFRKVMRFGDDAPSRAELDGHLAKMVKTYKEIDDALADASKPLEPFVLPPADRDEFARRFGDALKDPQGRPVRGFAEQPSQATPRPHSADFQDSKGRMPGEKGYNPRTSRAYAKDWRESPPRSGVYLRTFEDGSSAELRVVDGKYHLTSTTADGTQVTIREGQVNVDPYVRKISTTSILNAHHGIQAAPMKQRFGALYDPDAAPTIWLRNGRAGSTHGRITAIEGRTRLHPSEPGSKLTPAEIARASYADMRRTAAREMRTAGVSETSIREYLTAHDRYFIDNILPKIPTGQRAGLLGDWSPTLPGAAP
jgi:hypothetical protein